MKVLLHAVWIIAACVAVWFLLLTFLGLSWRFLQWVAL